MPLSPLPFGVQCVPDEPQVGVEVIEWPIVSIAFRRSVRSRRKAEFASEVKEYGRLHCLSAFSAFPTNIKRLYERITI